MVIKVCMCQRRYMYNIKHIIAFEVLMNYFSRDNTYYVQLKETNCEQTCVQSSTYVSYVQSSILRLQTALKMVLYYAKKSI